MAGTEQMQDRAAVLSVPLTPHAGKDNVYSAQCSQQFNTNQYDTHNYEWFSPDLLKYNDIYNFKSKSFHSLLNLRYGSFDNYNTQHYNALP